ncbi:MAG: hypothetical protein QOG60_1538 [Frankiaceae bacterium]|nr:hypothetical protein [Frankiaceae bacterium]
MRGHRVVHNRGGTERRRSAAAHPAPMPDFDDLVGEQCGVFRVSQATERGWTRSAVAHRATSGRWQRVHPGVYETSTGALTTEQRMWAAFLYAGKDAALSHRAAWWWADRKLDPPEVVRVAVPLSRVVTGRAGLHISRTGRWDPQDLHPVGWPARFRVERAVLDCAAAAATDDGAIALLGSAVQRRTTHPSRLRPVLERSPALHRRRLLSEVLDLADEGAHTLLEVRHATILRSHGLPDPQRQRRLGPGYADAAHEMPLGTLVFELDGRLGHFDAAGWWKDMTRDNQNTVDGVATLRFPGFVLLTDPHAVAEVTARALQRRGWSGSLRCPAGCPGLSRGRS